MSHDNMYKEALMNFAKLCNKSKQKAKHQFIYPLRSAGFTLSDTKNLGFKCSGWLWKRCLNQMERDKGKLFINFLMFFKSLENLIGCKELFFFI